MAFLVILDVVFLLCNLCWVLPIFHLLYILQLIVSLLSWMVLPFYFINSFGYMQLAAYIAVKPNTSMWL